MKYQNRIVGNGEESLDQIMFNPRNWRIHPLHQQDALKGVLEEVGWVQQVIVNKRTGNLIDGHLRCQLAVREGNDTIPVVYVDLSEEEEALILSTLDPIAGMAATDKEKLDDLFRQFNSDNENVQKLIADIAEKEKLEFGKKPIEDAEPQIDKAEELRVKWGVETGQLWKLGEHRIICGDCTDKAVVDRLMQGKLADTLISDPPYGIDYEYVDHDDSNNKENLDLVKSAWKYAPISKAWTCGKNNLARDLAWNNNAKVLCWHKGFAQAGNGLGGASTWEPVLVVGVSNGTLPNDYLDFSTDRIKGLRDLHTCPKPIALFKHLIEHLAGDIVYEPFCGSGTTILACESLSRKCRAIEISPAYVAVSIQRWVDATGGVPELIEQIE